VQIKKVLRIAIALIILGFVILVHEFGHFATCKLFNISTPTFSIGFGPPLVQKQIGNTTFQIAMLPFGGYVSMNATELRQAPYWQKMIITLAGIFNNFLLAFIILILLFYLNRTRLKLGARTVTDSTIDNLGIILTKNYTKTSSFSEVLHHATTTAQYMIKKSFYFLITFFRPETRKALTKPIGIISLTSQSQQKGFNAMLFFIASISIELGVFNSMPIPLLDGGQALYLTLEALLGHALTSEELTLIHFIYLMILIVFVLYLNRKARLRRHVSR